MRVCLTVTLALALLLLPAHAVAKPTSPSYLVMGPLYPFTNLNQLVQAAQTCYDNAIPFVLLVAPVYQNTQFPAMWRFCDALQYAQSRGGTILMREAILLTAEKETVPLEQKLQYALEGYAKHGIQPSRIQVPDAAFEHDLWYNPDDDNQTIEQLVDSIRDHQWVLTDYAQQQHIRVHRVYQPKEMLPFEWRRGFESAYAAQVFVVDRWLQIIVTILSVILLLIIALGFRINRRKNILKRKKRDRKEQHHGPI